MSLKQQILTFIEHQQGWVHGGLLEDKAREWGYKASNCSRRARELENEGSIERKNCDCVKPSHVVYRIKLDEKAWYNQPEYQRKPVLELNRLF